MTSHPGQHDPKYGPPNQAPPMQGQQYPPHQYPQHQGPPQQGPPQQGPVPDQFSGVGYYGRPGQSGSQGGMPHQASNGAVWVVTLGLVSVIAIVLGLTLKEGGDSAWHTVHAWGGLAIVGGVLTLAPAAQSMGIGVRRAWQVSAVGSGLMVLFWILLVLPDIGSNTSLLTTIGTVAGVLATWLAPQGIPQHDNRRPPEQAW